MYYKIKLDFLQLIIFKNIELLSYTFIFELEFSKRENRSFKLNNIFLKYEHWKITQVVFFSSIYQLSQKFDKGYKK